MAHSLVFMLRIEFLSLTTFPKLILASSRPTGSLTGTLCDSNRVGIYLILG